MFTKSRMDAFTDAVMAIVLTMMSLSIPTNIINGYLDIEKLFMMIGIYLVSFCFIAAIWYQRSIIFSSAAEQLTNKIVFYDLILLFFLSLTPILTKLMIDQIDSITVTLYGLLIFIIFAIIHFLRISILKTNLTNKNITSATYKKIRTRQRKRYTILNLGIIFLLIIGIFFPIISFILYLVIIIEAFLFKKADSVDAYSSLMNAYDAFNNLSSVENKEINNLFEQHHQAKVEKNHQVAKDTWNELIKLFEDKFNINKKEALVWVRAYQTGKNKRKND